MDDPTDAGMEREDLGPMTSTESQVNADIVQRKDTAVCRSDIAGVDTMDAQEIDAEGSGVQPLLTTPETDSGGGAGEEEDLHRSEFQELLSSPLDATETLAAEPFHRWTVAIHW